MISRLGVPWWNELWSIISEDFTWESIFLESFFQNLDSIFRCRSIKYPVTGNQSGRIIHKCDEPPVLPVERDHLPISLPHWHGVISLIIYPFPLFLFLHTGLHSIMVQKNPIDCIMEDVDSVLFLDLLLQEGWSKCIFVICGEDECFCFTWDLFRFPAWLPWIGIKSVLLVKWNNLVNPLSDNLVILCYILNRPPVSTGLWFLLYPGWIICSHLNINLVSNDFGIRQNT